LVKAVSYPAEWWGLLRRETLVFTPYAIQVLEDNCNFSHEKISALTGYAPGSIEDAITEQIKFYFEVYKGFAKLQFCNSNLLKMHVS
jgi:dihydroflavonol-4-reductase